ncbi:dehydrogenase [Vibrio lentus]|uniref:GHMP family kinase ATP-binding protein n=1 Tax=Vibrio lentus TaxID=136468 RepID=UPI000C820AFD|nr:dehydrogenase [Vibrio lentus]PML44542.1 dehydrogenase [Vibrio lentus]PMN32364.1 dehydrogenase [Vibrio lentus]
MKVRSKAPLRLGIAGGGTDVSPYSDTFGGCVLNATINMYAYSYIDDEIEGNKVYFEAVDLGVSEEIDLGQSEFGLEGKLKLHRAVYLRVMNDYFGGELKPLRIITHSDAPAGSGLGSSSTVVVSMLQGLTHLYSLPLGEYDLAQLAFSIERVDCSLSGGKQDQYAATFGGFNFMEFYANNHVVVNPLRIRRYIVNELESSLILYFTGTSRDSAKIIDDQIKSLEEDKDSKLEAMHSVKQSAYRIKEHLLKSDIDAMAADFLEAWESKKKTSSSITNPMIQEIENEIFNIGAKSMKVSGAGGGGFMMIFVQPEKKNIVERKLEQFGGQVYKFQFVEEGAYSWTI